VEASPGFLCHGAAVSSFWAANGTIRLIGTSGQISTLALARRRSNHSSSSRTTLLPLLSLFCKLSRSLWTRRTRSTSSSLHTLTSACRKRRICFSQLGFPLPIALPTLLSWWPCSCSPTSPLGAATARVWLSRVLVRVLRLLSRNRAAFTIVFAKGFAKQLGWRDMAFQCVLRAWFPSRKPPIPFSGQFLVLFMHLEDHELPLGGYNLQRGLTRSYFRLFLSM
jgi:hypothetical protein